MNRLLSRLWHSKARSPDKPFRDKLLSIERLEERALALAASFTVDPSPRRRARNIFLRHLPPRGTDRAELARDVQAKLNASVPGTLARAGWTMMGLLS